MKIFLNWFLFLSLIAGITALVWHRHWIGQYLPDLPQRGTMTGLQVVVFALAFSFAFTELKLARHKPLNCLKCLTGWVSLILAFTFHVQFWWAYLFVGLFVAAVFSAIKMRWL